MHICFVVKDLTVFAVIEEESLDEFEVHAEREDAAVVWEVCITSHLHAHTTVLTCLAVGS